MSKKHKITGTEPQSNTKADLFPMHYIRYAIERVQKAEETLKDIEKDDGCQILLVNLDVLITLCQKYPTTAAYTIYELNRKKLKENFDLWWARNAKKIPLKYRDGIKQSSDLLFEQLFAITSWVKED